MLRNSSFEFSKNNILFILNYTAVYEIIFAIAIEEISDINYKVSSEEEQYDFLTA